MLGKVVATATVTSHGCEYTLKAQVLVATSIYSNIKTNKAFVYFGDWGNTRCFILVCLHKKIISFHSKHRNYKL